MSESMSDSQAAFDVQTQIREPDDDILLVSRKGSATRFKAGDDQLRPMGRATSGVTGMKFRTDQDAVLSMSVIRAGQMEADTIVKAIGGKGNVVIIEGPIGQSAQIDRSKGIMDVLSKTNKGKGWGAGALNKDYVKRLSTLAKKPVSAAAARAKANKLVKKAAKSAKKAAKKG